MMPRRHGRGDQELRLASCPSGPTRLGGFDRFSQNRGEATRMFWKDHLPPCKSLPYQLAEMAGLAPRGAGAIMPVECPAPLRGRIRSKPTVVGPSRVRGFVVS